jgi:class 3 adenylate cyclase
MLFPFLVTISINTALPFKIIMYIVGMDRITYISSFREHITFKDVKNINKVSVRNNSRDNLTGILLCFKDIFYQIIEGDDEPLYQCFDRIQADDRHSDIFILNIEKDIKDRMYSQWEMETIVLDNITVPLIAPIRKLMDSLAKTHWILKKYAPIEVLDGIQKGENPLTWEFERDEMVILFSDLICFTTITEKISLAEMRILLDSFFEIASVALEKSGGRISKFTGDGFIAYYPSNQATSALQASIEIIRELKKLRETAELPFLKLAYCGIGISAGMLVKGNIGSATKKDYTVLGDVVNSASRLESLTRESGHSIIFDHHFMKYYKETPGLSILKLGKYTLKGKTKESTIFTVQDPNVPFDRTPKEIAHEIRKIK